MIHQNPTYKIALVGDSLALGGAEKVHAQLSVYFASKGIDVHNCIFLDRISYEHSGKVENVGKIATDAFFIIRKAKRFFHFRNFIKNNSFDYIIDFRMRNNQLLEFLISKFVYGDSCIYSVRSGILDYYFPKNRLLSRYIYSNKKINTVSIAIADKIVKGKFADNAHCIYNPVDFKSIDSRIHSFDPEPENYILAAGRMNDDVKQFDKLIEAYSKSVLPEKNVKLVLLGEGQNQGNYKKLASSLGLADAVIFKDFVENPFPYYNKALFTVLSSRNEGFPNVLIESLASSTPVIAFDCFSGPGEIVSQNENGLLIENQNFEKLTEAMDLLFGDKQLYEHCKRNARQSVERFSLENIGRQWLDYLKIT